MKHCEASALWPTPTLPDPVGASHGPMGYLPQPRRPFNRDGAEVLQRWARFGHAAYLSKEAWVISDGRNLGLQFSAGI